MTKQRALEATLHDMALDHARNEVTKWKRAVFDWKHEVERCGKWRGHDAWWAWEPDWRRAQRKVAAAKLELAKWKARLKALKS